MKKFEAGDQVIVIDASWRAEDIISLAYSNLKTVYKVYKTGNFVLEKGGYQFNQDGNSTGEWSHVRATHATPERRLARTKAINAVNARGKLRKYGNKLLALDVKYAEDTLDILQKAGVII